MKGLSHIIYYVLKISKAHDPVFQEEAIKRGRRADVMDMSQDAT